MADVRAGAPDEGALRRTIAALQVSRPHTWRSAGRLVTMWAVYAGCAVVALRVDLWPVQAVLWFVMSWVLLGNGAVVKDGWKASFSYRPDFVDLLSALSEAEARFLIVGGYAVALHGRPRATKDIDI